MAGAVGCGALLRVTVYGAWAALPVCVRVCVCVCVRLNNIKEGGPHGSRAPSGRLRRQLEKDKNYSPDGLWSCLWCLLGSR
jgi:hypothetical protein